MDQIINVNRQVANLPIGLLHSMSTHGYFVVFQGYICLVTVCFLLTIVVIGNNDKIENLKVFTNFT